MQVVFLSLSGMPAYSFMTNGNALVFWDMTYSYHVTISVLFAVSK